MMKKQPLTYAMPSVLIGILFLILPIQVKAQSLPFGGIVSTTISCTCSGTRWIHFTPLYLGGPTVTSGALVYSPFSTILYANFNIGSSGKWHLGSYLPGVQACWIRVWKFCLPLPNLGLMTKVGTN